MTHDAVPEPQNRKVAVVTGGAHGIGRAVLDLLAQDGYRGVSIDPAEQGGDPDRYAVDVTDDEALARAFADIGARYGRIDALVLCAGVKVRGSLPDLTPEDWDRCFAINVRGTFQAVRHALPWLERATAPSVVTLGSASAHAERNALAYAASKGAVLSFTRALALDLLTAGIRVNAVLPGFTDTGMAVALTDDARRAKERENVAGRLNTARDVAEAVRFLISDRAATTSGAILDVAHVQGAFVTPLPPGVPNYL